MQTAADFEDLVVRQVGEERVRLGDVADVELAAESTQFKTLSSGRDAVFMSVTPNAGCQSTGCLPGVHAALPRIRASLPADLELFMDWDGSIVIDEALKEVVITLVEAALIVILVIYLFLGPCAWCLFRWWPYRCR